MRSEPSTIRKVDGAPRLAEIGGREAFQPVGDLEADAGLGRGVGMSDARARDSAPSGVEDGGSAISPDRRT